MAPSVAPLTIRPETGADHDVIRRVVGSAFGADAEADLVDAIRASPEYVPDLALVAELDGEVVGHVMISRCIVRTEEGDRPIVMLSPLAVAPDHQRTGIGGALVQTACAAADEQGEPVVVVEGDPRYYSRFGFEDARTHGLVLPLPEWAPPEAGQVRRLRSDDPALAGSVIYPPAFDGLE